MIDEKKVRAAATAANHAVRITDGMGYPPNVRAAVAIAEVNRVYALKGDALLAEYQSYFPPEPHPDPEPETPAEQSDDGTADG